MNLALFYLLIPFGVLLLFVGLGIRMMAPDPIARALKQQIPVAKTLEEMERAEPFRERVLRPALRNAARAVGRFTPQRNIESSAHLLDLAGNPFNWTVVDLLGVQGIAALATAAGVMVYEAGGSGGLALRIVLVLAGAGLGYYIPIFWLKSKAKRRQDEIQSTLPDALDLLTISVEAGLGLDAAILRVTQKWENELSRGFARVLAEVRVGKLRREALRDMANRMDVGDVANFVAAIIQAEQMGASIINVMRIQSEQMRMTRRQRAQEKAQKAPLKMLFPLLIFIFPSLFIVILGPAVIRIMNSPLFAK